LDRPSETKVGDTAVAVHPKDKRFAGTWANAEVPSVEGTITSR
jgi:valyl-tRNA synthetase